MRKSGLSGLEINMETKFDVVAIDSPCVDLAVNVEKLPAPNRSSRVNTFSWQGGGKASSGIVTAARMGAKCAIIGAVGDDMYGRFCKEDFERHGVDTRGLLIRKGARSAMSVVLSDRETMGRSICWSSGDVKMPEPDELDEELLRNCRYVFSSKFNDLTYGAYSIAKDAGAKVFVDGDSYKGKVEEIMPLIDVFVGSEFFYNAMFPDGGDMETNIRTVMAKGPEVVVFTFGERGCAGVDDEGFFELPAFKVDVVDTLGAGDDYHGAFVALLCKGFTPRKAALWASAVSAIKCTRIGGRAGIPNFETLTKFMETGEIDYTEIDQRVKFYENPFEG